MQYKLNLNQINIYWVCHACSSLFPTCSPPPQKKRLHKRNGSPCFLQQLSFKLKLSNKIQFEFETFSQYLKFKLKRHTHVPSARTHALTHNGTQSYTNAYSQDDKQRWHRVSCQGKQAGHTHTYPNRYTRDIHRIANLIDYINHWNHCIRHLFIYVYVYIDIIVKHVYWLLGCVHCSKRKNEKKFYYTTFSELHQHSGTACGWAAVGSVPFSFLLEHVSAQSIDMLSFWIGILNTWKLINRKDP